MVNFWEVKYFVSGPVKQLCSLAPNNVNTMAAACIAGHNLGFENVTGRLVSDPRYTFTIGDEKISIATYFYRLADWHIVEAEIRGMNGFTVNCVRKNPAKFGAVSGAATYVSFWSTLQSRHVFLSFAKHYLIIIVFIILLLLFLLIIILLLLLDAHGKHPGVHLC